MTLQIMDFTVTPAIFMNAAITFSIALVSFLLLTFVFVQSHFTLPQVLSFLLAIYAKSALAKPATAIALLYEQQIKAK